MWYPEIAMDMQFQTTTVIEQPLSTASAVASEPRAAARPTHEMIQAAALLEVQGVSDAQIMAVLGSRGLLDQIRQLPEYGEAVSGLTANLLESDLSLDTMLDKLEHSTLGALASQVASQGTQMETHLLLGIAKHANSATRRHGSKRMLNSGAGSAAGAVVINIPILLAQRINAVQQRPEIVNASAAEYVDFSDTSITANDVSRVLGIDVKQRHRAAMPSDLLSAQDRAISAAADHLIARVEG